MHIIKVKNHHEEKRKKNVQNNVILLHKNSRELKKYIC